MKVLITTSSFGKEIKKPLEICKEKCEVFLNPYKRKLTTEEFLDLTKDIDAVIAGVETITREILQQRRNIKVISRCGIGMDNIDLNACVEFGIRVFNTPEAPSASVSELTITFILCLLKKIPQMNAQMKNGNWNKLGGSMLEGKKVGIIGYGRIGKKVSKLLHTFHTETAYYDVNKKEADIPFMPMKDLMEWADIITLHCSDQNSKNPLIGKTELNYMKQNAILINTARGSLIDEEALFYALKENRIQGAALDVFQNEPYSGCLKELDNIILTPHIASSAKEARAIMELEAVYNLFHGLEIEYDKSNHL